MVELLLGKQKILVQFKIQAQNITITGYFNCKTVFDMLVLVIKFKLPARGDYCTIIIMID